MMRVYISGIGLLGAGLDGWEKSIPVLSGQQQPDDWTCQRPSATVMPAIERRRASAAVRLGVHVAQQALESSGLTSKDLSVVFSSSDGDTEIIDYLCQNLATKEKIISPTRFHNSVHNAPAGYWSIATESRAPSSSISCYDFSFAGGLLDSACRVVTEDKPVLLSAFDIAVPDLLYAFQPIGSSFGIALVLEKNASDNSVAQLDLSVSRTEAPVSRLSNTELERLRQDNPSARALPLLCALACGDDDKIVLELPAGNRLDIELKALPLTPSPSGRGRG
ncbi:MAG: hypothetical protein BMS9Abin33_0390 [Gammaproteobacteria bacterium]|nr:MAG: hypothetical protein BMS9Abin33_0390 [Gammaproteobacteria bacterium]